jgi:predicted ester cyclase
MTAQENEAVVRRMIEEVWNDHDFANFEELVADDNVEHMVVPEHRHGIAGERYAMELVLSVFPDHRFEIEDAVASGDRVAVRGTCSGTHEGELLGK